MGVSLPDGSKRRQFAEFLKAIVEAIRKEGAFQEAEELLAELRRRGGDYLASTCHRIEEARPAERLELLEIISRLEDRAAVPQLERLIFETSIDLRAKLRAADVLEELGSPLERGLSESLRNAVEILEGLPRLRPGALHGSHPLFLKFLQLPPDLRQGTLSELAASQAQVAFDLIQLFQSREPRLHAEAIDALSRIQDPRAADLLEGFLEASPDKETAKRLRLALYRLKGRGMTPKGGRAQAKRPIYRPSVIPSQGYISAIDGRGNQMVWLLRPQPRVGRVLFDGVCHDVEGLLDFRAFEVSPRALRELLKEAEGREDFPLVEVPVSYSAHLLELAYQRSQERKGEIPKDYPLARSQVAALVEGEPPPPVETYRTDILASAEPGLWRQAGDLLKEREFAGWAVEEEAVAPFIEEVRAIGESPLIVAPHQREGQFEEICRKATREVMDEARRRRYGRRLEDMAYILYRLGRKETARLALSAADETKRIEDPGDHPFLLGLIKRVLLTPFAREEAPSQEASEPSLIVSPYAQREASGRPSLRRPGSPLILPR